VKKSLRVLLFLLLGGFLLAGNAWAIPILTLSDGSNSVTIQDNSTNDSSGLAGVVVYNGAVGTNFIVNVTTGLTKPIIGSSTYPELDLNSVNVSSSGQGTLTISWTDTDFNLPDSLTGFVSKIGGTTAGTVDLWTYLDEGNSEFGEGTLLSHLGSFDSAAFSGSDVATINPVDPFSLTLVAEINHSGAGQVSSFDAGISPVPEPATMLLLGVGLCGLAFIGRKKLLKHG